jgi:hypothetical protein
MVCEEKRVGDNGPCIVPRHFLLVNEHAHELDDRERWMSVIELDSVVCAKRCSWFSELRVQGSKIRSYIRRTL